MDIFRSGYRPDDGHYYCPVRQYGRGDNVLLSRPAGRGRGLRIEGCMRLCEVHFAHAQPLVFRVYGLPVARSPDVDGDSNCFELGIAR